jgi:hypothetical protein
MIQGIGMDSAYHGEAHWSEHGITRYSHPARTTFPGNRGKSPKLKGMDAMPNYFATQSDRRQSNFPEEAWD